MYTITVGDHTITIELKSDEDALNIGLLAARSAQACGYDPPLLISEGRKRDDALRVVWGGFCSAFVAEVDA